MIDDDRWLWQLWHDSHYTSSLNRYLLHTLKNITKRQKFCSRAVTSKVYFCHMCLGPHDYLECLEKGCATVAVVAETKGGKGEGVVSPAGFLAHCLAHNAYVAQ